MMRPDMQVQRKPVNTGRLAVWGLYGLTLLVLPQVFASSLSQTLLSQMGIAIIACLSFNLLLGQGGMLSFGHAVYSGMGAFLAMHTLNRVSGGWPLPVSLIPVVGGLGSMGLAMLLGWVTTKKAATPFAMITFGLGELVWATALMFPAFFGGEAGISGNRVTGGRALGVSFGPQIQMYYLIAAYTFVCTALMFAFTLTPLGRVLNAVRDNPLRAAFLGFNPHVVRYLAFVIAAFFAGISGGLAALNFEIVTTEVLSAHRSGAYLLFTLLGGTGFFFGPMIGAVLMVLAFVVLSAYTQAWLLYLGLVFVGMVMFAPGGVASLFAQAGQLARDGVLRQRWPAYVRHVSTALLAFAGASALLEMVYHLQHSAALGPQLRLLGVTLDVTRGSHWLAALCVLVTGLGLFVLSHRHGVRQQGGAA